MSKQHDTSNVFDDIRNSLLEMQFIFKNQPKRQDMPDDALELIRQRVGEGIGLFIEGDDIDIMDKMHNLQRLITLSKALIDFVIIENRTQLSAATTALERACDMIIKGGSKLVDN